jgi:GntR family transcriptional repressor for pyruvate dehydrogenase complex
MADAEVVGRGSAGAGAGSAGAGAAGAAGGSGRTAAVVERLEAEIRAGTWPRDSLLPPERVLCGTLGVSRPALREAIRILQSRGLLLVRHGVGARVTGATSRPVKEVYHRALGGSDVAAKLMEARLALEPAIAALAAARADAEDLSRIEDLLDAFAHAMAELPRLAELDVAFHQALASAARNPLFTVMLEPLGQLLAEERLTGLVQLSPANALAHHRAIHAAVAARRPELASRRMRQHLEATAAELGLGAGA